MLFNCILLSLSTSIDSLGIGITYGMKNTKISFIGKLILFGISFFITSASVCFGDYLTHFFPESYANWIGAFLLIFIGIVVIVKAIKESYYQKQDYYDYDHSNLIDPKESVILGIALSIDSFGIGLSSSFMGINSFFFPLMVGIFQFLFLSLGNFLGKKIHKISQIPDMIWSILSGILLIFIAFLRLL
jgi:putative Mn2+ efflux pump MntP